ncbi:serine hydrolase domain-containing protein [Mycobacterium sp. 852013-51886_SCH5428379]|uniref:serine hydrolase domain-containing protein n=1 Tax=Mycobacterium sp. 852013-51886_SCH5428379 TaxID=1834111 RepID=UPI000B3099EA
MPLLRLICLIATVLAVAGPTATASAAPGLDDELARRLDAAIDRTLEDAAIPGAIVGVFGPDGDYVRAVGVADKTTGAPMEPAFFHRIGSLTKTFTVTAVLQLAGDGRLSLDDPIDRYVPGVPSGADITLRQLARMQSGLPNYTANEEFVQALMADPLRPWSPPELLAYAFAQPPTFPPGEGFEYSNTNTVLLGLVVEKISGRPLHDVIRDRITAPLQMTDTAFPTGNEFPQPHAQGYTVQTADGREAVATEWNPSWGWAAGAMTSTLADLRIWAPALANGTLVEPHLQQERLQGVDTSGRPTEHGYGLGLFNAGGWIGHNGSLPGYQTVAVYLPGRDLTLIVAVNTDESVDGTDPGTAMAVAVTQILTPDAVYRLG